MSVILTNRLVVAALFFNAFFLKANIYVSYIGLLGNKMFQYAVGYAVAKETGFDLYAPYDDIDDIFNIEHRKSFSGHAIHRVVHDLENQKFDPSIFFVGRDTQLYGFFQSDKYFIKYRSDLIRLFSFRNSEDAIKQRALNFIKSFNKCFVCMHVRAGDFFSGDWPVMDSDYYIKAINLTLNKLQKNLADCAFVIISNDVDGKYISNLMIRIRLSFPDIDLTVYKGDIRSEFALMREADVCVTSASTFSWWASWLNLNCKIIVSPLYWLNYYRYGKIESGLWCPNDIAMSLPNQYFIRSEGHPCHGRRSYSRRVDLFD